jgi:CHAT domain-containing protein
MFAGISFGAIEGTKYEAQKISKVLKDKNLKNYSLKDASEKNLFKQKDLKVLHIASHGFFLNDKNIVNPMLRSGVVLAGANTAAKNGIGDGIITSLKLSGMNLRGCDLVVLSACETGVVDIKSSESVSGLNKAFMQAGTKDMVMSLWSVSDAETAELMIGFYEGINKNLPYSNSLRQSKLKMIKEGKHPFYWAPFILSGL